MARKFTFNYTQNFNSTKRLKKNIRFVVYHYTGMKSEKAAINRLIKPKYKVSAHFFIKYNGDVICMVPERYIAWHAGKSQWKNFKMINKNSIGIEISNQGHNFKYTEFNSKQVKSIIELSKYLKKKYKIKKNCFLGHSDIAPDRKIDPGEKFPWEKLSKNKIGIWSNLNKKKLLSLRGMKLTNREKLLFFKKLSQLGYMNSSNYLKNFNLFKKKLCKVFQMRFRQELVNGIVDQECLLILKKLSFSKKINS